MAAATAMVPLASTKKARATFNFGGMCLARGTTILSERGPVEIERLAVGDRVLTASGAFKPVVGIGNKTWTKEPGAPWPEKVAPVRIAKSAIAAGTPCKDLYLSPEHALFTDGYLIKVKFLVNGASIAYESPAERDVIEYYHVRFEEHEVVFADGLAVESMRSGNATASVRFDDYRHADGATKRLQPCAPMLGYSGGRQNAIALLRLAVYPFIDVRDRIQIVYDRIATRAKLLESGAAETLPRAA
jgi:hypothetical protein